MSALVRATFMSPQNTIGFPRFRKAFMYSRMSRSHSCVRVGHVCVHKEEIGEFQRDGPTLRAVSLPFEVVPWIANWFHARKDGCAGIAEPRVGAIPAVQVVFGVLLHECFHNLWDVVTLQLGLLQAQHVWSLSFQELAQGIFLMFQQRAETVHVPRK
eukprot:scaffold1486_cov314-Pavlova_lutheri.AAC.12